jgi:hypothetical protein
VEIKLGQVEGWEVVLRRHHYTVCRANRGAEAAEAAFGHVNVKRGGIEAFACAVRRLAPHVGRLYGYDVYTVYRAYPSAFIADDAVVHLNI